MYNDILLDFIFLLDIFGSLWYYDYLSRSMKVGFDDEKVFVNLLLSYIWVSLVVIRVLIVLFGIRVIFDINYVIDLNINNYKCNFKKSFYVLKFCFGLINMYDVF